MKKNNTSLTLYSLLVLLVIHMYACTSHRGTSYPQENCLACEAIGIECLVRVNTYDTIGIKNGHEYVDLGLPSGTLWATCNIGAEKPEAFGDYFQWAGIRTEPGHDSLFIYSLKGRKEFCPYKCIDSTFRDSIFPTRKFTKYNSYAKLGIVDNKKELDLEDDAAYIHWGTKWRIPSKEQFNELFNNKYTRCLLQTHKGVWGCLITSKIKGYTGKSIFLPAAGCRLNTNYYYPDSFGYYWSSDLDPELPEGAMNLYFTSNSCVLRGEYRYYGYSIRPVSD